MKASDRGKQHPEFERPSDIWNIKSVAVTAGYMCAEPRTEFDRHMDAANVDLIAGSAGVEGALARPTDTYGPPGSIADQSSSRFSA